jgi:MoaA/NifB/PqqE/SkfB family radical SAM enzyme
MSSLHTALTINEREEIIIKSKNNRQYIHPLNRSLRVFFKEAVKVSLKNPAQAYYFYQTVRNQQKAAQTRAKWEKEGLQVPPIMILSITNRCNLHCQGCYHQALRDVTRAEMSEEKLRGIIREGRDLGVSFMVLAGGEPLVRKDILDITRDFPEVIFLMFTNGLLITDEMIERFKAQKNIVPLISIEGYDRDTDSRRGSGVYERLQDIVNRLKKEDVFFGVSITVTRSNFSVVTDDRFVENLNSLGCKFLLFAEYTPVNEVSQDWVITDEQRNNLSDKMRDFRARYSALFVSVPGDEKDFGGCLSAGRGFVHVSAEGDLEPCPFAPYSDVNLRDTSLKEALKSPLLKAIRESRDHTPETGGSCALWAKREWVRSLLAEGQK